VIRKIINGLLSKSSTWAEDWYWGYRTPIYVPNHIIWLQVVVEIITIEMARALHFLAKQSTMMCNGIYQNHLALGYLLASEGGVCGKFNLSNYCLQIDAKGKVIEKKNHRQNEKACPCPHPHLERMDSQ
jgi:formate dehydrogenase assembly factor FdhD